MSERMRKKPEVRATGFPLYLENKQNTRKKLNKQKQIATAVEIIYTCIHTKEGEKNTGS